VIRSRALEVIVGRRGRSGRNQKQRAGPQRAGGARKAGRLPPAAQARLKQAHAQRQSGENQAAAATFLEMASGANDRAKHGMAAHLAMEGARALVAAGDEAGAVEATQAAVRYAAPMRETARFARKFGRLVARLREGGHDAAADAIEAEASERLGVQKLPAPDASAAPPVNRAMRRSLPRSCPTCGAPVASEKTTFTEAGTADCRFCGVVLTG